MRVVALLAESVDRNIILPVFYAFSKVALLAESVDRNIEFSLWGAGGAASLSLRRAWIEILAVWAVEHAYQRRSPCGERG